MFDILQNIFCFHIIYLLFIYYSNLASNTKNVHCPFNHSHIMPNKTFILHLMKCPDRPPNTRTCGFNTTHVLFENDDLEVKYKAIN